MPIDPSIALQVKPVQIDSPLNALARALQVQGLQNQNQLAGVQVQQAKEGMDRTNKLRQLLSSFTPDMTPEQQVSALTSGGYLPEARSLAESASKVAKEKRDAEKSQIEGFLQKINIGSQILGSVTDPISYERGKQMAAQAGFPAWPDQYDPNWVKQQMNMGLTMKDRAEAEWKARADETTRRGQDIGATTARRGQDMTQATAIRGQDLVDKRARIEGGKAPAGYRFTSDGSLEAIPGGPADAKAQAEANRKAGGMNDVDVAISTLRDAYDRLEKGGGITSTENGPLSNLSAAASASGVGQAVGRAVGTQNQSARNDIAMARPALLAALMRATGMSAKQMDSNAELKLWLTTATDPTLDIQSNRRALNNIEKKYLKPATSSGPTKISSDAEYNALPSGATFIDPEGKTRRKP